MRTGGVRLRGSWSTSKETKLADFVCLFGFARAKERGGNKVCRINGVEGLEKASRPALYYVYIGPGLGGRLTSCLRRSGLKVSFGFLKSSNLGISYIDRAQEAQKRPESLLLMSLVFDPSYQNMSTKPVEPTLYDR